MKTPDLKNVNWKDVFIGDYDWAFLCTPRLPWSVSKQPPPFYGKDEPISVFVAFIMGLQHCLTMVGGIITVPLIISGPFLANFTPNGRSYIISAALIVAGICTIIQVVSIPIPFTRYRIGSGLLSVMGVSFTFLPIAQSSIPKMTACTCGGVKCNTGSQPPAMGVFMCYDCTAPLEGPCNSGEQAYGRLLGTILVCCWLQVAIAFMPLKVLRRLFPPVVSGVTVILIGLALGKVGFTYWGGGAYCYSQVLTTQIPCDTNGQVMLPFGSSEYVGLGFTVFFTLVLVELFGSPFMRNVSVAIGLMVGMIVASSVSYNDCTSETCTKTCFNVLPEGVSYSNGTVLGAPNSTSVYPDGVVCTDICTPTETTCVNQRYVTGDKIAASPWITFLWVNTYPLGFYGPAVLPMLFGFIINCMECIGDVTATMEASGLVPTGEDYEKAVQGGILADGLNCFWGALATSFPCVTYAENNGIISLTRCGARRAGVACGILLILIGIIQKFAAIVLTIPDCVLGGMTSFLFFNVAISGMRILTMEGGINRRNRFIAAMSITLGAGVAFVPEFFNIFGQPTVAPLEGWFWPINPDWSAGFAGFRDAIIIVLTNGFSLGGLTAMMLNLIVPFEADDEDELGAIDLHAKSKIDRMKEELPHPHLDNPVDPLHPHKKVDIPDTVEAPLAQTVAP